MPYRVTGEMTCWGTSFEDINCRIKIKELCMGQYNRSWVESRLTANRPKLQYIPFWACVTMDNLITVHLRQPWLGVNETRDIPLDTHLANRYCTTADPPVPSWVEWGKPQSTRAEANNRPSSSDTTTKGLPLRYTPSSSFSSIIMRRSE